MSPSISASPFGLGDLHAAVDQFAQSDRSAARYRDLARTVTGLMPRFKDDVADEAERHLVFLALGPLEAHYAEPLEAQLEKLAVTVWPTALQVEPKPGEKPRAYAERICREDLAIECKYVVAEYRALVLSALVWERFRDRAREALRACRMCNEQPAYAEALAKFEKRERLIASLAAQVEKQAAPSNWPRAGDHAEPWSGAPVLAIDEEGKALFEGRGVPAGGLAEAISQISGRVTSHVAGGISRQVAKLAGDRPEGNGAKPGPKSVVGVYLLPTARIGELRELLVVARAAGYSQVALQVRSGEYPFRPGEYRITTGKRTTRSRIRVRDEDTIQNLVQALDAAATETGQVYAI